MPLAWVAAGLLSLPLAAADLPVDRRIGQTLMATAGPKDVGRFEGWIREGRLAGLLLRPGGLEAEKFRELTSRILGWASESGAPPPLLAVDNEGGPTQFTLKSTGLTMFPSNMARGATYSDLYAFLAAYWSAKELRSFGVGMNFAPVLDVNTNPVNPIIGLRSFGGDADEVAALGAVAIEGARRGRVAAVAKHFPGHGDTARDSHATLPKVAHPAERLEAVELKPFRAAIAAGVPAIMTAHVAYPALDPSGLPATLSKPILDGLLRGTLGFQGVVVTDSLDMRAIADDWTVPEASVRALAAGADLLLIGGGDPQPVFDRLVEALSTGELSSSRLDQASRRILRLKEDLGLEGGALELGPAERDRIRRAAEEIADQSVTLISDRRKLLPLPADRKAALVTFAPRGYGEDLAVLENAFLDRRPGSAVARLPVEPGRSEVDEAVLSASGAGVIVVGTFHWGRSRHEAQVKAVERLARLGAPIVLVSLMNPFDQEHFEPAARLATYGITASSMRGLSRALLGGSRPKGVLPVQVSTPSSVSSD